MKTRVLRYLLAVALSGASLYYFPLALGDGARYEMLHGELELVVVDRLEVIRSDLAVRTLRAHPDADVDPVLVVALNNSPYLFRIFALLSLFAPGVVFLIVTSVAHSVFLVWFRNALDFRRKGVLPAWPLHRHDKAPALCIGEVHYKTENREHPHPRWLVMPEKGLYTGLAIFGAIGTGKTTSCMRPFCRQLLEWQSDDPAQRVAMLVLEVKGDFCYDVQEMLEQYGRTDDYMELSLDATGWQWNPLNAPWLDTYSLAYTVASLVNQLFGKSKEPFWQQAYTNLIRWIIETYRSFDDPWFTFKDIYDAMLDRDALGNLLDRQTEHVFAQYRYEFWIDEDYYQEHRARFDSVTINDDDVGASADLVGTPLADGGPRVLVTDRCLGPDRSARTYKFNWVQKGALRVLRVSDREFMALSWEGQRPGAELDYGAELVSEPTPDALALNQEIHKWYRSDWLGLDDKLRSSIVEGMSVFLGIFVVPSVARIFCPKNPKQMTESERSRLMPRLDYVIESGKVLALNMPAGTNPALARAAGVMLKQSWLSTLLLRPKAMKKAKKGQIFRPAVFVCDEYQSFVTCGEDDPSGDEKAFALTRQSKCIPIVATQSISSLKSVLGDGESWRALLQTLRSRIYLSLADDFSLKTASELLGQVNRMKASYSISENTGKASASLLTGRMGGGAASAGLSKSYQERREPLFHPRDLSLLGTCQAVAQIFDGAVVRDATRVYLKADYRDRMEPYFRWFESELQPASNRDVA